MAEEVIDKVLKLRVRDVMSEKVVTVNEDITISEAAKIMSENKIGCLIISKDKKVVGIVTERDLVRRVLAEKLDPEKTNVGRIMSKPVIVIKDTVTIEDAVAVMAKNGVRRLPVINEEYVLVGIVTATDLAKALAAEFKMRNLLVNALARVSQPPPEIYG